MENFNPVRVARGLVDNHPDDQLSRSAGFSGDVRVRYEHATVDTCLHWISRTVATGCKL